MALVKVTVTQEIEIDDQDWKDYSADPDWIFSIFRDRLYGEETKWQIEEVKVIPNG
jgi:hypothetical protein